MMKLPNELTQDKSASFALSWALAWRVILVIIVVTSIFETIPLVVRIENTTLFLLLNLLIILLLIWFWIHRVLKLGLGRVKIIFMEERHYDELVKKSNSDGEL